LKQRSKYAGAVLVRFAQGDASIAQKLSQLNGAGEVTTLGTSPLVMRVFPEEKNAAQDLARVIGDAAAREGWPLQELHTEEGRLDDVFRNITIPDTTQTT
jgi:ABC-2 type transport system ATP-binding protein